MSFILDALRKSEHERQRQNGPAMADLKHAPARHTQPVWIVAIAALLAVNLAVVLFLVLRKSNDPTSIALAATVPAAANTSPPETAAIPQAPAHSGAITELSPIREEVPPPIYSSNNADIPAALPADPVAAPIAPPPGAAQTDTERAVAADPKLRAAVDAQNTPPANNEALPSYTEVALNGKSNLPDLHLDIHVYAPRSAERFVFINMNKYKEGGQTPEGIKVERITQEGAILNHKGVRFVLSRQ